MWVVDSDDMSKGLYDDQLLGYEGKVEGESQGLQGSQDLYTAWSQPSRSSARQSFRRLVRWVW